MHGSAVSSLVMTLGGIRSSQVPSRTLMLLNYAMFNSGVYVLKLKRLPLSLGFLVSNPKRQGCSFLTIEFGGFGFCVCVSPFAS